MNDWLVFGLVLAGAYLLGSVPTAYLAARWFGGVDIRKVGTRNVGSSNVLRTVSKWVALPVLLLDAAKGAFMVWAAGLLGLGTGMQAATGIATIVGHNWPVFLNFQGGRGIATSLGVILVLSLPIGIIALVGSYLFAIFKEHGLGVFCVIFLLPFMSWFFDGSFGIDDKAPVTLGFVAIAVVAYGRRLAQRRSDLSRTTPTAELFFNRLFFDRDIRDRKAWLNRSEAGAARP